MIISGIERSHPSGPLHQYLLWQDCCRHWPIFFHFFAVPIHFSVLDIDVENVMETEMLGEGKSLSREYFIDSG